MANPLLSLNMRPWRHRETLRRRRVPIPTDLPSTDAIFLVLRQMRGPLIALLLVFAVSVVGLVLIPGVDDTGAPYRLSFFDAFYFMTYTAATIGFSEYPFTFTVAQRMWVTVCIYASVIMWAYTLGSLFALLQDPRFRRAMGLQRFRRKVKAIREPFWIIVGYGEAGRSLAAALDGLGRRTVVLDEDPGRIDVLVADQHELDVPNFAGDPRDPSLLGYAGLAHPRCQGVLAMTDKDEMNLAVIMSARLLRPGLPVITRCSERGNIARMQDFGPTAVINPFDRYGHYLVLDLQRPVTSRLAKWLLSRPGSPLPKAHPASGEGAWVVVTDDVFGPEVTADLQDAGLNVRLVDVRDGDPDVSEAVGLVAGTSSDTVNLALAAHARLQKPDIFISLRQRSSRMTALVESFSPDAVFVATDIVAYEALARLEAPLFWGFIEHLRSLDDEQAAVVLKGLRARFGSHSPTAGKVTLGRAEAPAVVRWLERGGTLTIAQLLARTDDRDKPISVFPTVLVRDDVATALPDPDEPLRPGDQLAFLSHRAGRAELEQNLFHDWAVKYVATGERVPETWLWRLLKQRG